MLERLRFRTVSSGHLAVCLPSALVVFLLTGAVGAGEDTAVAAKRLPFGFRALEIYKASGSVPGIECLDLDRDGLTDIVYPDNDEATVVFLLQYAPGEKPEEDSDAKDAAASIVKRSLNVIESDTRFRVEKFHTDKHIVSFAVADFDGDDKPDLAYSTDPPELEIVYQRDPWGTKRTKMPIRDGLESSYALEAADVDGDGRDDLVFLGKGKTYLLLQQESGGLAQPQVLHGPVGNVADVEVIDVDGDGRNDLVYVVPGSTDAVAVRLGGASGFGPLRPMEVKALSSWLTASFALSPGQDAGPTFFAVEHSSSRIKAYRWSERDTEAGFGRPRLIALASDGDPAKMHRMLTDVDGDGRTDVVVSYPEIAQLSVSFQDDAGSITRTVSYPTLSSVTALAAVDLDGDGRAEIVVASKDEKVIGVTRWQDDRLPFPETSPLRGEPLRIAATHGGMLIVEKVEGGEAPYELSRRSLADDGSWKIEAKTPLALPSAPSDLRVLDVNSDGRADALVLVPYAPPVLLLSEEKDDELVFSRAGGEGGVALGQLARVEPRAISVIGGGLATGGESTADALLVTRSKYARAVRLETGGGVRVLEQFSGRGAGAELQAASAIQLDDDPELEVVLLDAAAGQLDVLDRGEDGYKRTEAIPAPKLGVLRLEAADMNGDGREDLVLIGKRSIAILPRLAKDSGLREALSFTVEKKEDLGEPSDIAVGDFNGDHLPDLVTNTNPRYNLLCLTPGEGRTAKGAAAGGTLELRLAFPIFEEKSYMRRGGGQGPRQMSIADFDRDGLDDLVLLIHDRILLYLQDSVQ